MWVQGSEFWPSGCVTSFYPLSHLISPAVDYGRRSQCLLALIPAMRPRLECSQPPTSRGERPLRLHVAVSFVLQTSMNSCRVTWSLTLTTAPTDPACTQEHPKDAVPGCPLGTWYRSPGNVTQSLSTPRKGERPRGEVKGTNLVSQKAFGSTEQVSKTSLGIQWPDSNLHPLTPFQSPRNHQDSLAPLTPTTHLVNQHHPALALGQGQPSPPGILALQLPPSHAQGSTGERIPDPPIPPVYVWSRLPSSTAESIHVQA
jgi:hypothetical protein